MFDIITEISQCKLKTVVCACVICIELKRKADGTVDTGPLSKAVCVEKKCTDLIVLGLPFKSTEDDLKQYFSQFGDLVLVQVQSLFRFVSLTFYSNIIDNNHWSYVLVIILMCW